MKKYRPGLHLPSLLILLLTLAAGCAKEQTLPVASDAGLTLKISTRGFIGEKTDGVTIQSVRIIISNPDMGNRIVENRLADNQDQESTDFVFSLKQGRYKISVVANETGTMAPLLASAAEQTDIDAVKVITPATEDDLVLYQTADIRIRPSSSFPGQGEVSADAGISWVSPPVVNVELMRVASKISLSIKKNTANPGDKFDIKKVELINLTSNTQLAPGHAYTGSLHSEVPFNGSAVSFENNGELQPIFNNYVVSEHLLAEPASSANATALAITADYTRSGGIAQEVVYTVPVLGQSATDYSLHRNCHYNVTATITRSAELNFPLIVEYEVIKWQSAGDGSFEAGAVTFHGEWEEGTNPSGNLIPVSNNTSVTYEFTLSFPPGATWIAQLTNIRDFDFDLNNNGVREGITAEGITNKIRIRPRGPVSTNNVTTEFYITVFNGIEYVELDLTNNGMTGESNRFIIKQNPN